MSEKKIRVTPARKPVAAHCNGDSVGKKGAGEKQKVFAAMFLLVVAWIFTYNVTVLGMGPLAAFFGIAGTKNVILTDAISFVLISAFVSATFIFADALAQIMSSTQGFNKVEKIMETEPGLGRFLAALTMLDSVKTSREDVPDNFSSVLLYSGMMYAFCFIFITAFSFMAYLSIAGFGRQALARITEIAIPLFAAALPSSARFLAIIDYAKAKEYARLIPYSLFTVTLLFLLAIFGAGEPSALFWDVLEPGAAGRLLHSALYLAFVPVFIETGWWLYKIEKED